MCGIIGWKQFDGDLVPNLFIENQKRGGYSVGAYIVYNKIEGVIYNESNYVIYQEPRIFNEFKDFTQIDKIKVLNKQLSNILVQFRASTVDTKNYVIEENYPLQYEGCKLFGNGVINADFFKKIKNEQNNNDLYYVLKGIIQFGFKWLERVEGTFALVFISRRNDIVLIRKDFLLYYNDNIISSVKFEGGKLLEHGLVKGWNNSFEQKLNLEKVYEW